MGDFRKDSAVFGGVDRKSIGSERTFRTLDTREAILEKLDHVAEELESDMRENGWAARTITLKYKLDTFQGEMNHYFSTHYIQEA